MTKTKDDRKIDVPQTAATLRDWFAAHALTGLVSLQHADVSEHMARTAYAHADAMLVARDAAMESQGTTSGL